MLKGYLFYPNTTACSYRQYENRQFSGHKFIMGNKRHPPFLLLDDNYSKTQETLFISVLSHARCKKYSQDIVTKTIL